MQRHSIEVQGEAKARQGEAVRCRGKAGQSDSVRSKGTAMQVMAELKKHYTDKLFDTCISRNVKLSEAPGFGMPVYYHDKSSKGSAEYLDVAKELSSRI